MSLEWITDLEYKFSNAEELVLYTYAGTLPTVAVYFNLPMYRLFVACENGKARFQDGLPSLVKLYENTF